MCGERSASDCRDQIHYGLRVPHVTKRVRHCGQRPAMFRVCHCRASIGDKKHLVVHHHRIPRGSLAADLRHGAGDDERVDPSFLQAGMQIRGARHESAITSLEDDHVLFGHVQFRPERVPGVAGCERLDKPCTTFRDEEMLEEDRPCADRLSICRVLSKGYNSACGPQGAADTVDIGYDCAGHWYFRHLTVVHEAVLQIDDDVRRVARAQAVKYRDATTIEHHAL